MSEHTPEEIIELARRQVTERRTAAVSAAVERRDARDRPWRYAFFGLLGALLLGLIAWPGTPLNWKMYAVVHGVCAQVHNVTIDGKQLPICARNTGIYSSFLVTTLALLAFGRGRAAKLPPLGISIALLLFVVALAVDGFNSLFVDMLLPHLYTPRNELRTLTGIGMGASIAVLLLLMLNHALRRDPDTEMAPIRNWLELGGILLLNLLVMLAIYGNIAFMYWPLAFIAWAGIIGVLYAVNLLITALFMRYEGNVSRIAQLARPATFAIVFTLLELGLLSWGRYWLEGQGLLITG